MYYVAKIKKVIFESDISRDSKEFLNYRESIKYNN